MSVDTQSNKERKKHSQSYTELIEEYVKILKRNALLKLFFKTLFFVITMGILIGLTCVFSKTIFDMSNAVKKNKDLTIKSLTSVITIVVPAISSLIVALIKIPQTIAQYLFDTEEDKFMNKIIENIQHYDLSMYAMENKITGLLDREQDVDNNDNDQNEKDRLEEFQRTDVN